MESPGEYLKREREIRGISIEAIASATKIRPKLLAALEKNDFDSMPASSFVKGFIQAYCKYLGLDVHDALLRYEAYLKSIAENEAAARAPEEKKDKGISDRIKTVPATYTSTIIAAVVIVAIIVAGGIYRLSGKRQMPVPEANSGSEQNNTSAQAQQGPGTTDNVPPQSAGQESTVTAVQPATSTEQAGTKTGADKPASNKEPQNNSESAVGEVSSAEVKPVSHKIKEITPAQSSHAENGQLTLVIEAIRPSWIKVEIDSREPMEASLKEGEKVRWSAVEKFSLVIGNAGGVKAIFNGAPIYLPAEEGKVVKLTLPPDTGKEEISTVPAQDNLNQE